MALLQGLRQPIVLDISDLVRGDSVIKRRARFVDLDHPQAPDGTCSARIIVEITHYAAEGQAYGPLLRDKGIISYQEFLHARNDTLVDAGTGEILAIQQGQTAEEWLELCERLATEREDNGKGDVMLQGDYFEQLRNSVMPVSIADLIRHHISQADVMGKFS